GDQPPEFLRPGGKRIAAGYRVRGHEAYIVPVVGVLRTRIAEACEQQHRRLRALVAYSSAGSAAEAAAYVVASPSSDFIAEDPAMVAMVKSRSEITGLTPSGSLTDEMCSDWPISAPSRSTVMNSGIALAGQRNSTSWRTTLRTPPRLMPGDFSSLMKCTG